MRSVTNWFMVGALAIIFVIVFRAQSDAADNIISRIKTKDPEQFVIAAAMTVGLGLALVVAGQAIRKVT